MCSPPIVLKTVFYGAKSTVITRLSTEVSLKLFNHSQPKESKFSSNVISRVLSTNYPEIPDSCPFTQFIIRALSSYVSAVAETNYGIVHLVSASSSSILFLVYRIRPHLSTTHPAHAPSNLTSPVPETSSKHLIYRSNFWLMRTAANPTSPCAATASSPCR